ncbi:histidine phosphatase superfamily [Xylaria palmicola]|nr:histidine phosphatase superfamily [Xylaria palmicola]
MSPIVHIVRHGESRHNVEVNGDALRDPSLTATGAEQAVALGLGFPHTASVSLFISSPMRRAIQTALLAFGHLMPAQDARLALVPELQESSARPSDTGSPPAELLAEFGDKVVDTSLLADDWFLKDASTSYGARDQAKVAERARLARLHIRGLAQGLADDEHIVVVAHSGFIKHLIQGAPKFKNAEERPCRFVDVHGDDDQALLAEIEAETNQ